MEGFLEPQEVIRELREGNVMEKKSAAKLLSEYKYISIRVKAAEERIEIAESQATHCTSFNSGMPSAHGGSDKIGKAVEMIHESQEAYADEIIELKTLEKTIRYTIRGVENPKYKTLLELYYLNGHTLERIAEELPHNTKYMSVLHKQALEAAQKVVDNG